MRGEISRRTLILVTMAEGAVGLRPGKADIDRCSGSLSPPAGARMANRGPEQRTLTTALGIMSPLAPFSFMFA